MEFIETDKIELKEKLNDNLIREIVSFLNTEGGTIYIGIKDNGEVIGIKDVNKAFTELNEIICDQIEPKAEKEVKGEIKFENNKMIMEINIQKGEKAIYFIKKYGCSSKGCLVRVGTSTREMSNEEIEERNKIRFYDEDNIINYVSDLDDLKFSILKINYELNNLHLDDKTFEKNLNLRNRLGSYNKLAELLANENKIDLKYVKFQGNDKTVFSEIQKFSNKSILVGYSQILARLEVENKCYVDTSSIQRIEKTLFDFNVAKEALLNAIVHNDWLSGVPTIQQFEDRIEIMSYGGLPKGLKLEEFYRGISKPRNPKLMKIFIDLNLAEQTGHGVPLIVKKYGKGAIEVEKNYIKITIPFDKELLEKNNNYEIKEIKDKLNKIENQIIELIQKKEEYTAYELSNELEVSKRTIERALASLKSKLILKRIGSRKTGKWSVLGIKPEN